MKNIDRKYNILKLLKKGASLLILGPRGAGKTTWIRDGIVSRQPHFLIIDLLASTELQSFRKRPQQLEAEVRSLLAKKIPTPVIVMIDEIQLVPQLFNEVHRLLESPEFKGVQFVLTGSSARKLKRGGANLLAGRAIHRSFFPFNCEEIDFISNLNRILQYGTLPKSFLESDEDLVFHYLNSYTNMYLKEEILQESMLRNIDSFAQFLELVAHDNGQPVNYTKLGKQVGLTGPAIKEYYQILIDTLIAIRIPAWTQSVRKQLQTAPKYYLFDNGIMNALSGNLRTDLQESSFRFGRLFENLIINEVHRINQIYDLGYSLFHYRTNTGKEIDLITQKNLRTPPTAIEIKSGIHPDLADVNALKGFKEENPGAKCLVICRTHRDYIIDDIEFCGPVSGIKKALDCQNS